MAKRDVAKQYQDELAARLRTQTIAPQRSVPPIPRLNSEVVPGTTMSEQAMMAAASGGVPSSSIFDVKPQAGLLPNDVLVPEAKNDPAYRQGAGADIAINQPDLARKHGVIRGGKRLAPDMLFDRSGPLDGPVGTRKLSQETQDSLRALAEFNEAAKKANGPTELTEVSASNDGGLSSAATAANTSGNNIKPAEKAPTLEELKSKLDDFDMDTLRTAMLRDILNNEEQRSIVEKRLKPLSLDSIIMTGYVEQDVPIILPKEGVTAGFIPRFRSVDPISDLTIKRWLMEEIYGLNVSERYYLDKYALMNITLSVVAINGKHLPDPYDADKKLDQKLFFTKFNFLMKYPIHMIASLGVHIFYFDIRCRKLFVAEEIKNG